MPPFKDEHILIIIPGSQTTLAQLGLPESFTTPSHRFPTRMFPAPDGKTWEPYKIRERPKRSKEDDAISSTAEQEIELVEFPDEDEGAVWPLREGRIVNLHAFFAFLQHIHNTLSPTLHTPILLVGQPCWTAENHEDLTQFVFEKFKTPGFCILDSAIATSYAFGVANATVIDVGFEKTDITTITNFGISARGTVKKSGGEAMTRRLMELLKTKNFTRDMAEKLKKSVICEILPPGASMPEVIEAEVVDEALNSDITEPTQNLVAVANADVKSSEVMPERIDDKTIEDDGVLDIATIVTSGKTQDFLAKKEKEKADRAAARKGNRDTEKGDMTTTASKPTKLPNCKRSRTIFHYEELVKNIPNIKQNKTPETRTIHSPVAEVDDTEEILNNVIPSDSLAQTDNETTRIEQQKLTRKEEKKKVREEESSHRIRRDIEVGIERFQLADNGFMDEIADAVYRTIHSIGDISKRQDAWESLIICGCGSKVRGFKEALLGILNSRYLVSPSPVPNFSSEAVSNFGTHNGTGNTSLSNPIPSVSLSSNSVTGASNPHILTAIPTSTGIHSNNHPTMVMASAYAAAQNHQFRSQSPTSIKLVSPPSYFPEWKQYEEAVFLGSQVAAKVFFIVDQGQSKAFLSRMEFNEDGPTSIHQVGLVY